MIESRYSVYQSSRARRTMRASNCCNGLVATHFATRIEQRRDDTAPSAAQARSNNTVSAAPQTPVRRNLAFSTMSRAMFDVRIAIDIDVTHCLPGDR